MRRRVRAPGFEGRRAAPCWLAPRFAVPPVGDGSHCSRIDAPLRHEMRLDLLDHAVFGCAPGINRAYGQVRRPDRPHQGIAFAGMLAARPMDPCHPDITARRRDRLLLFRAGIPNEFGMLADLMKVVLDAVKSPMVRVVVAIPLARCCSITTRDSAARESCPRASHSYWRHCSCCR